MQVPEPGIALLPGLVLGQAIRDVRPGHPFGAPGLFETAPSGIGTAKVPFAVSMPVDMVRQAMVFLTIGPVATLTVHSMAGGPGLASAMIRVTTSCAMVAIAAAYLSATRTKRALLQPATGEMA